MIELLLHPHPLTACDFITRLSVAVQRHHSSLQLTYTLTGDVAKLRIPPPQAATQADELWRHTCFEAFISIINQPTYLEFNFSPSTQWASYFFSDYRTRAPMTVDDAPSIACQQSVDQVQLHTVIQLPDNWRKQNLQLGLTTVVEDHQGQVSYWALHHPSAQPDFHDRGGFTLECVL